jgi:Secretion system C-terminal sorting domain
MKRLFLLVALFAAAIAKPNTARAQKEAAVWYFGYRAGLDFNMGNPIPLQDGAMKLDGGCAVISDKESGKLLFYTDGRNFWNRQHGLMPGSNFLPSNCYTRGTQPAVIVPDSENNYLFNVFCLRFSGVELEDSVDNDCIYGYESRPNPPGRQLYYFLIDIRLDNGRGDIVADRSNILLMSNVTEKLSAVPHTNGKDYWVLAHGWNNNRFYAYPLSSTTVGVQVITDIGSVHQVQGAFDTEELGGDMKASPNGKKIACAIEGNIHSFDLFDFDASTGSLSNYINLGDLRGQYGLSFSPDNSKLYVGTDSPNTTPKYVIFQYDLSASGPAAIVASGQSIILNNPYTNIPYTGIFEGFNGARYGFQLGLDGRLYVMSNNSYSVLETEPHIMVMIDQPNKKGFDCQVNYRRFDFGEGRTGIGFPNFMQSYFNNIESITVCDQPTSISFYPNPTPDKINIDVLAGCSRTYSLEIINILGQVVFSQAPVNLPTEIDISSLASGLYFFRVITPGRAVAVKKIVKV